MYDYCLLQYCISTVKLYGSQYDSLNSLSNTYEECERHRKLFVFIYLSDFWFAFNILSNSIHIRKVWILRNFGKLLNLSQ